VHVLCASGERRETLRCRQVIVTIPLGVLQADPGEPGAIRFDPQPGQVLEAARALESGAVWRVTFRFETAFWEARREFASAQFIFSQEPEFPTWWKPAAEGVPILVGWSAGPAADRLVGLTNAEVTARAVASLERIVRIPASAVRSAWFHDWQADPFSRGAYSYIPAGQLPARNTLAHPVRGTLYFAGEATDCSGQGGTVHGAIASGRRAARQALADYRKISRLTA
jgi:monoamine oxidase